LPRIAGDFKSTYNAQKVYVSILAGVSIEMLKDLLASNFEQKQRIKLIRSMPNTSMQVAAGCTVYTGTEACSAEEIAKIDHIFNSLGTAALVEEKLINASTGLSGCGPAYVYTIIEALADGGVKQGLPREMAIRFAAQTLLGAGEYQMILTFGSFR
jgi:pyrroline-5-carboxylate reductase